MEKDFNGLAIGIAAIPLTTNQGFINLIPNPSYIDSRYLAYTLQHYIPELTKLAGNTTFKEISRKALKNFTIPLPTLSEQHRIVEILDQADALRRKRLEADKISDRILPNLFIKMFGNPVTLSTVIHPSLQLPILNNIKTKLIPKTITNSITAFRVGSFKAFSDIQYIPIRPLTLIYGANSSGKSSILHSILLTHHAIKNKGELDIYCTEAGGDSVDLGGFSQYVHKRDRSSQVQWAIDLNPKHLNLPDQGLADFLKEIKSLSVGVGIGSDSSRDGKVSVRSFYLEAEGEEILSMSSRSNR